MHPYRRPRTRTTAWGRQQRAFSLIEILVVLAVAAVLLAVAIPVYNGYSVRAYRTQVQADLLRCAQGMERHAASAMGYANAVDVDGDGQGDQSTGPVSANLCRVASTHYRVSVRTANAAHFVLRAEAVGSTGPVAADGALEIDAAGERRWDRNDDGDFADYGERGWGP